MSNYHRNRSKDGRTSPATRELNQRLAPTRCHPHDNRRGMGREDNGSNTSSSNSEREVQYPPEVSLRSASPPSGRQRPRRPINRRVQGQDYQLIEPRRRSRPSTIGRIIHNLRPYPDDIWEDAAVPTGEVRITRAAKKKIEEEKKKEEAKKKKEEKQKQKEKEKKEKKDKKEKEKKAKKNKRESRYSYTLIPATRNSVEAISKRSDASVAEKAPPVKATDHPMRRRSHMMPSRPLSSESEAEPPMAMRRRNRSAESAEQKSVLLRRPQSREYIGHPKKRQSMSKERIVSSASAERSVERSVEKKKFDRNKKKADNKEKKDKKDDKKKPKEKKIDEHAMRRRSHSKSLAKTQETDDEEEPSKDKKKETKEFVRHPMRRRSHQAMSLADTQEYEEEESKKEKESKKGKKKGARRTIRLVKAPKAKI